jgi:accessory gene regulator B
MIIKLSNMCGKWLASKVTNDKFPTKEDQIQVYAYGFQVILGSIFKGVLLLVTGWLLGVLFPVIVVATTFSSLRILAGGYHEKTYLRCIIASLLQFFAGAFIARYLSNYQLNIIIQISTLFVIILLAIYIIIKYVPRDTPNRPIKNQVDIKRFKRMSLIYMLIWSIIMAFSIHNDLTLLVFSSYSGLLLELFSVSKLGNELFSKTVEVS